MMLRLTALRWGRAGLSRTLTRHMVLCTASTTLPARAATATPATRTALSCGWMAAAKHCTTQVLIHLRPWRATCIRHTRAHVRMARPRWAAHAIPLLVYPIPRSLRLYHILADLSTGIASACTSVCAPCGMSIVCAPWDIYCCIC